MTQINLTLEQLNAKLKAINNQINELKPIADKYYDLVLQARSLRDLIYDKQLEEYPENKITKPKLKIISGGKKKKNSFKNEAEEALKNGRLSEFITNIIKREKERG